MKTENAMFVSVFVKADEVAVATNFDYKTAKDIMVNTLSKGVFNLQVDEALIFKAEKSGIAEPIFNYRAYVSDEPDLYKPSPKKNDAIKIFFECPKCGCEEGRLGTDEDMDIIMKCKKCGDITLVK